MSSKTDFSQIVSSELRELSKYDCNGALPYLCLTSKYENVVRDLLAFRLHKKFQEGKFQQEQGWFAIAREKTFTGKKPNKKVDIAIFERGKQETTFKLPVAIIELKVVAQPTTIVPCLERLGNDLKDAKDNLRESHSNAHPTYLGLLLAREARALSPDRTGEFEEIIGKYELLSSEQDGKLDVVYSQCAEETRNMSRKGSGKLCCGNDDYIGASVDLKWWRYSL
jgi:hypothetical protein